MVTDLPLTEAAPSGNLVGFPLLIFTYKRPAHLAALIDSLTQCPEWNCTPVYAFCDGARTSADETLVRECLSVLRAKVPTASIVASESNKGLSRSITEGVEHVLRTHEACIVVEDDLIVAASFLAFMNRALIRYANETKVMQVSGFAFERSERSHSVGETCLLPVPSSWGWGTWRRAWSHFRRDEAGANRRLRDREWCWRFDLDGAYDYSAMLAANICGLNDSWAIWWRYVVFERDGVVLYPGRSLVENRGFGPDGTHTKGPLGPLAGVRADTNALGTLTWPPSEAVDTSRYSDVRHFIARAAGSAVRRFVRNAKYVGARYAVSRLVFKTTKRAVYK